MPFLVVSVTGYFLPSHTDQAAARNNSSFAVILFSSFYIVADELPSLLSNPIDPVYGPS